MRHLRRLSLSVPAVVLLLIGLSAVFAPQVARHDPAAQAADAILRAPDAQYWFGTDQYGRDVFSRVVFGSRASLVTALLATAIACVVGTAVALVAGYVRGWVEQVLLRAIDVILCLPPIISAILVVTLIGPGQNTLIGVIAFMFIPTFARLTYGEVLSVGGRDFVTAARSLGCGPIRIMVRTILPNVSSPIIVQFSLSLASAILIESGLSFLGLGVVPPTPSWGEMISTARATLLQAPWVMLAPAAVVVLVIVSFNLLGDALRGILDPHRGDAVVR